MKFTNKKTKYKIGIFGSASGKIETNSVEKAKKLGISLSKYQINIITGACSGLPYLAAHEAASKGSSVLGYSPKLGLSGQRDFTPKDDLSIYKKLIFVPQDFEFAANDQACKKYRNVISTANCDAGVIISGRWGTMNEFTNLYDMGKVIGVITGTGGIADELLPLCKKISKKNKAIVLFDSQPEKLIEKIIKELGKRI